jgi:hypothetical protein
LPARRKGRPHHRQQGPGLLLPGLSSVTRKSELSGSESAIAGPQPCWQLFNDLGRIESCLEAGDLIIEVR